MKIFNTFLLSKAKYNINLLINNNKKEKCIINLKSKLDSYQFQNNTDLIYINNKIDKIFISHSIKEALYLLQVKNINITKYEKKYITKYQNNDDLVILFNEIENDLKYNYKYRNKYIILPFYYNIYLNKMP